MEKEKKEKSFITSVVSMLNHSSSDLPEAHTASFMSLLFWGERFVCSGSYVLSVT